MKPSTAKVLTVLKRKKTKGVTFSDFPTGFELGKRLHELRCMGYAMTWEWVKQSNKGQHKCWFLIKEPKLI